MNLDCATSVTANATGETVLDLDTQSFGLNLVSP
jgi:hypothetical protein